MAATSDQDRIAVWYAVWATICAAAAGVVVAVVDAFLLNHLAHRADTLHTLTEEAARFLAVAAGQGAVALVTAGILGRMGRTLQATVLLGLIIGAFDFLFSLLLVTVPAIQVTWAWVIALLASAAVTAWGARATASAA